MFSDQKLYDKEYLLEKSKKKAEFLDFFGGMKQNPSRLEAFIAQNKNPLFKIKSSKSPESKENPDSTSVLGNIMTKSYNPLKPEFNCQSQNTNIIVQEITDPKSSLQDQPVSEIDQNNYHRKDLRTFSIQHEGDQILIREFERLSEQGVQLIKHNSKYLNVK